MIVDVIIPALNEEKSISHVLDDIPSGLVRHIYVCDNGSSDRTAEVARLHGAIVLQELEKGYGAACLKAIHYIHSQPKEAFPDIIVFIDADYSDFPEEIPKLIQPILDHQAYLVIGSRVLGKAESGSLTFVQRFGNALSTHLIRWIYGYHFTDLGPFRAIRFDTLVQMNMQDRNYGWTVEMQIRAAIMKIRSTEVPVDYKIRIGRSKVSGTIKGSVLAGYKILYTIFKMW